MSAQTSPTPAVAKLTPMLRHYLQVKEENPDTLLLYRMGDFYELFFEDAIKAAPALEVALTARQKGTPSEAPMCGVPHHAIESYIAKLIEHGYKVAVCDQVEDPKEAKGLVKREVTRVVTPGTLSELELLDQKKSNRLASVVFEAGGTKSAGNGAVATLDVSTGSLRVEACVDEDSLLDALRLARPREILYEEERGRTLPGSVEAWLEQESVCRTTVAPADALDHRGAQEVLVQQFDVASVRSFGFSDQDPRLIACAHAIEYARSTSRHSLDHVRQLAVVAPTDFLVLDETTLRNLEVFENQRQRSERHSLVWVLDQTQTGPGARLLRDWLGYPLRSEEAITNRLDGVEELLNRGTVRSRLRAALERMPDLERLVTRAVLGRMSPREAGLVRDGLDLIPELLISLGEPRSEILEGLGSVDPVADLRNELARQLVESPPATLKDGGILREGVCPQLDEARDLAQNGKTRLVELEAAERDATGIAKIKVRYNRVFGYFLEVPKSQQERVPDHYDRKQTLANAERYVTTELKELEERILGAESTRIAREEELFETVREQIASEATRLQELAYAVASLDAIASLAEVAALYDYRRPALRPAGDTLRLESSRHPVVERLTQEPFVPNDLELDPETAQIVILTGPNMGGKSTYLRQIALVALMAHIGSFVPAESAEVPMLDRIFTRVGASDDLVRGESTFMVEMIETANILRYATAESLVVLDEVGRGTATFDGLSVAWAIVEHMHEQNRSLTLFATHYHELTELAGLLPRVRNRTMTVKEWENRIVFLHRVESGAADKSYGLHVARLAGLPESLIERAQEILGNLEAQEYDVRGTPRIAKGTLPEGADESQLALFASADPAFAEHPMLQVLRDVDLDRLTPLAALNLLSSLKERLESGEG